MEREWAGSGSSGPPAVLGLAQGIRPVVVAGSFDEQTSTWSDRNYACMPLKKHNEAM